MGYSIENSEDTILRPNSEFERRVILQYYLDNDISINLVEREILLKTNVSEAESIGIIGCLLQNKTPLNILRLAIGSKNRSNIKLAEIAKASFNKEDLQSAENFYFKNNDNNNLTQVEKTVKREFNTFLF